MEAGLYGLQAQTFLIVYAILFVGTLTLCFLIVPLLRPNGRMGKAANTDQLAYLAGGSKRLCETVALGLMKRGCITISSDGHCRALTLQSGETAAERALIQVLPAKWPAMVKAMREFAEMPARGLLFAGLAMNKAEFNRLRLLQTLPLALLFIFGAARWVVGNQMGHPTGYLSIMLIVTLFAIIVRYRQTTLLTNQGLKALHTAKQESSRLRHAPTQGEMEVAVALFGTAVLAGSSYFSLHQFRQAGGDGGGDGGGCGGGCGGCGG